MKESITKFDLEAAFKALNTLEPPAAEVGIKANKPALTEIFSRKSKFDSLFEEYYDVGNAGELESAKESREAEIAKAKLDRIEKIVDLDAKSPEDLLTSYVGKFIIQCPQCLTLFYKNPEDVEESDEDPTLVNVNEACQHCGNESGYTLVGKVGEAEAGEFEEPQPESESEAKDETVEVETDENDLDVSDKELDLELDDEELEELDIEIEDDEDETKKESLTSDTSNTLVEKLNENTDLEVSANEFEKLISSTEFKKSITDSEVRNMIQELGDKPEATEKAAENLTSTTDEAAKLEEGIFDNLKDKFTKTIDKIANNLKSREAKADWILNNAIKENSNAGLSEDGKVVIDDSNKKFNTFVVIGFKETYSNGKPITLMPSFDNKDLVVGKEPESKKTYSDADNIAKGWSLKQGNGPAFIYLAQDVDDENAVFLCGYFKGELKNDQLEKYFKIVKDDLKACELMAKGNMDQTNENQVEQANELENNEKQIEDLDNIIDNLEELHEASLEKHILTSLANTYDNIKHFKITECIYLDKKLSIKGDITFKSGKSKKTNYVFTEALLNNKNTITFKGFNEQLFGLNRQLSFSGYINEEAKSFITESFK